MSLKIGVGIHDVTGPCCDVGFWGYVDPLQKGEGIRSRLASRAFVLEDTASGKNAAIVCADLGMCSQAMQLAVVKRLKKHFKNTATPDIYSEKNVLISANHTHSGPGGYSHYLTYNVSMGGFKGLYFDYIVESIFKSIVTAHENRVAGKILIARGNVDDCCGNRSLPAYENNPQAEKDLYGAPLDKEMTLLKFVDESDNALGAINWFACHPTSMGQTNTLISGCNKGYAQDLFEREKGVISAFANSNCGDTSPNMPHGRSPGGVHDFRDMAAVGEKIYQKAAELFDGAVEEVGAAVDWRQTYVDMSHIFIEGSDRRTWPAALGYGMSKGSTEDSTGAGLWSEGTTVEDVDKASIFVVNRLLNMATELFGIEWPDSVDKDYVQGHYPKPILFHLGLARHKEEPLVPSILPLQLIRLGSLVLIAHPGEISTMAGRRLRNTVLDILGSVGVTHALVVSYAGAYSSYTTTKEEYDTQQYEGASTLFGPWTLAAYQQENARLARALRDNTPVNGGPKPADLSSKYRSRASGLRPEMKPLGADFGDVKTQPNSSYQRGDEVSASFWGGHPNNKFNAGEPLLLIEKESGGSWQTVYTDKEFCTVFKRKKRGFDTLIEIKWEIPEDQDPGSYRIRYKGYWKSLWRGNVPIDGVTKSFTVLA